jgi:hypothetical protein
MKKLFVLLLVAVALPVAVFADLQLGVVGMYNGGIDQIKAKTVGVNDFTFGAEARLKLGIFQGAVTGLYYPEVDMVRPAAIVAATDVGLAFDVLFLRLGAGIGPNFAIPVGDSGAGDPAKFGANIKLTTDFRLGNLSLGLVGFYYLESFKDLKNVKEIFSDLPWLGITAMFKLF